MCSDMIYRVMIEKSVLFYKNILIKIKESYIF